MHQDKSVEGFRCFINWALDKRDLEFLDDVSRFLRHLYIFAKMQSGGNEYSLQLEKMQNAAHRLIRSAESLQRYSVPICLYILANSKRGDRMILDLARIYAPVASDVLELPELEVNQLSAQCSDSSLPPA